MMKTKTPKKGKVKRALEKRAPKLVSSSASGNPQFMYDPVCVHSPGLRVVLC